MHLSFTPPRQVKIGDAAAFAGTTPRAIRHYHQIGLLQEPERGADGLTGPQRARVVGRIGGTISRRKGKQ